MMRDDVRKLIGSYATGSLTESERKLLFEAALEDQELFDELAREDALRELLDTPGAKQRLIAALETPASKPAPVGRWFLIAAAVAVAVIAIVLFRPQNRPAQVADAIQPTRQVAPREEVAVVPKELARTVPAPRIRDARATLQSQVKDLDLEKNAEAFKDEKKADVAAAAPPPPPAVAEQAQAVRQFGAAGAISPTATSLRGASKTLAARFAFDYSLNADRTLRIAPAADGYLSVEIVSGDEVEVVPNIGQNGFVRSGATISLSVPNYANAVSIRFSASPGRSQRETLSRRNATSGTVEDPNPSPESGLSIQIPAQPVK